MAPSLYLGCSVEDDIAEALQLVRGTFQDIEKATAQTLADLQLGLTQLSSGEKKSSAILGAAATDQVIWMAQVAGAAGDQLRVMYRNLGPIISTDPMGVVYYSARPTSTEVIGTTIYVNLAILGGNPAADPVGTVDPSQTVATCLPLWLSDPAVSALVTAQLVGDGSAPPVVSPMTQLSGGADTPLKYAEDLANSVASQFGHTSYQALMRAADIPVIESASEAAKYLEDTDGNYVIINKKLFLVEGTNLVGLRTLYQAAQQDLPRFKTLLASMRAAAQMPHIVYDESVETLSYDVVCSQEVSFTTLSTFYLAYDTSTQTAVQYSRSKSLAGLNTYSFWISEPNPTAQACLKLQVWGFPDDYITGILSGTSPEQSGITDLKPPTVVTIETPDLLDQLQLTDAEIVELFNKSVDGVKVPTQQDRQTTLNKLLLNDRQYRPNGMKSKTKKSLAAAQAIDLSSTMNDQNLARELATRGKACARKPGNFKVGNFQVPNLDKLDLPNLPSASLPDLAKKVESAFAALSSVISSASKLFDKQVDGLLKTCKSVLNKVQNLLSLATNLFNNKLADCLLGTSGVATGKPDVPSPSNPGGIPSVPTGGLPLPKAAFALVFKQLSISLDKTITTAFEQLMSLIQQPLCMVMTLLSSMMGMDLGGAINPCLPGKDPKKNCPNNETQETINASADMTTAMTSLPQMKGQVTQQTVTQVTEQVQNFTGKAVKQVSQITQSITRGVNEVIADLMKGLDSKMKLVEELFRAVTALLSETLETANQAEQSEKKDQGCKPPSLGALSDSIMKYI